MSNRKLLVPLEAVVRHEVMVDLADTDEAVQKMFDVRSKLALAEAQERIDYLVRGAIQRYTEQVVQDIVSAKIRSSIERATDDAVRQMLRSTKFKEDARVQALRKISKAAAERLTG